MAKAFNSLQRQNLSEQVVHQIGLSIMRNDFKPGDTLLSEPELSLQFNVSRPVTREALKILSAKGLIESRPKTGTKVRSRAEWEAGVNSPEAYIPADLAFHAAICTAAHNEMLQKITETLTVSLQVSRVVTSHLPGANLAAMPLHWSVAEAIREGDEQAAEEAMRELVILTTSDIQRALERKESGTEIG